MVHGRDCSVEVTAPDLLRLHDACAGNPSTIRRDSRMHQVAGIVVSNCRAAPPERSTENSCRR